MMFCAKKAIRLGVFMLLIGSLLLTGCTGLQKPVTDPTETGSHVDVHNKPTLPNTGSPQETEPPETTEPEEIGMTVKKLRETLKEQGKCFAVVYLGFMSDGDSVWSFLEDPIFQSEELAFLNNIPEHNVGSNAASGEVYCIVSADPEATIEVYSDNSTDGDELKYDELVFEGSCEAPILLVCNKDFYPDTEIALCLSNDKIYRWYPQLNPYGYVDGLWGGEMSQSEDGYETLDVSPYNEMLLAQYQAFLDESESDWELPIEESLRNSVWYDEGYDIEGDEYLYRMVLHEEVMDIYWKYPGGDENKYIGAPWSLETKDGVAVLTIDLGDLAGVRSYDILVDYAAGFMYAAVDVTESDVQHNWEDQYRFLLEGENLLPDDMVGTWEQIYTEVEGDRVESDPGACTLTITGSENTNLCIEYIDALRPEWSYSDVWLFIMPADGWGEFEHCTWKAVVNNTSFNTTREIYLIDKDTMLILNSFTVDGAPMVSCECFQRVE